MTFPLKSLVCSLLAAVLFFGIGTAGLIVFPPYVSEEMYLGVTIVGGLGLTVSLLVAFGMLALWIRDHPIQKPTNKPDA